MAKDEQSNQLNLTVVALVALVAIVGLVALVMNAATITKVPQLSTGSQIVSAQDDAANLAGEARMMPQKAMLRFSDYDEDKRMLKFSSRDGMTYVAVLQNGKGNLVYQGTAYAVQLVAITNKVTGQRDYLVSVDTNADGRTDIKVKRDQWFSLKVAPKVAQSATYGCGAKFSYYTLVGVNASAPKGVAVFQNAYNASHTVVVNNGGYVPGTGRQILNMSGTCAAGSWGTSGKGFIVVKK